MIEASETDLICDLAETYGITDYRALPLKTAAALSAGLRDESRSKMRTSGQRIRTDTALIAAAVDRLAMLVWMQSEDGAKRRNRPESILARLMKEPNTKDKVEAYNTPEEFEAALKKARENALKAG